MPSKNDRSRHRAIPKRPRGQWRETDPDSSAPRTPGELGSTGALDAAEISSASRTALATGNQKEGQ
jgi:hypothetical protein